LSAALDLGRLPHCSSPLVILSAVRRSAKRVGPRSRSACPERSRRDPSHQARDRGRLKAFHRHTKLPNYVAPHSALELRRTLQPWKRIGSTTGITSPSCASKSRTNRLTSSTSTRPSTAARTTTSSSPSASLPGAKSKGHPLCLADHGHRGHLGMEHGRRARLPGNRRARRPGFHAMLQIPNIAQTASRVPKVCS